jgi:hypothetical protein
MHPYKSTPNPEEVLQRMRRAGMIPGALRSQEKV